MYAELILATYYTHISQNKLWFSGCTNLLFCIGVKIQTKSLLELSMLRLTLQFARIYTVLFCQTKIGKNETILTKESIVSSTTPFCRRGQKNFECRQKVGTCTFWIFSGAVSKKGAGKGGGQGRFFQEGAEDFLKVIFN